MERKPLDASREQTLATLVPKFREIHAQRVAQGFDTFPEGEVTLDQLIKLSFPIGERHIGVTFKIGGRCFRVGVMDREYQRQFFSALINPEPPGKYLGGTVHVMGWKRGPWEAALMEVA
jgi:hypothetical protein